MKKNSYFISVIAIVVSLTFHCFITYGFSEIKDLSSFTFNGNDLTVLDLAGPKLVKYSADGTIVESFDISGILQEKVVYSIFDSPDNLYLITEGHGDASFMVNQFQMDSTLDEFKWDLVVSKNVFLNDFLNYISYSDINNLNFKFYKNYLIIGEDLKLDINNIETESNYVNSLFQTAMEIKGSGSDMEPVPNGKEGEMQYIDGIREIMEELENTYSFEYPALQCFHRVFCINVTSTPATDGSVFSEKTVRFFEYENLEFVNNEVTVPSKFLGEKNNYIAIGGVNSNGDFVVVYNDAIAQNKYVLAIFNQDGKILKTIEIQSQNTPSVSMNNEYIHIIGFFDNNYFYYKNSVISDGEYYQVFSDVTKYNRLFEHVYVAYFQGWISGYPDGSFKPEDPVNRVEFAKMLMLAFDKGESDGENLSTFPDVHLDQWYVPVLSKAVELEIMEGYPDGYMRPGDTINQAEALKMAYETDVDGDLGAFEGDEWYDKYLYYTTHTIDQSCSVATCQTLTFLNDNNLGNEMTRGDCILLISEVLK